MNKIWSWLAGEVRTLESIVAHFHTTIADLETHAAAKVREAMHHADVATAAADAETLARDEAVKAAAIAANLSTLVIR